MISRAAGLGFLRSAGRSASSARTRSRRSATSNGLSMRSTLRRSGPLAVERLAGPTGHEQDRQLRPFEPEPAGQLEARHAGHDGIGHEQVDVTGARGRHAKGLDPARRGDHDVARTRQDAFEEGQDRGFVLDNEDRGRSPGFPIGPGPGPGVGSRRRRCGARQQHADRRSGDQVAVDPDPSPRRPHGREHRRQPESAAAAVGLGREERQEDPLANCLLDATARKVSLTLSSSIPCADAIASGWLPLASSSSIDKAPALGHRIVGVDREVDEHLLELSAIGLHPRRARGRAERDLNVHPERSFKQREQAADEVGQVECLGTDDARASRTQAIAW